MEKKWNFEEAKQIFQLPFFDVIYKAQTIHRENFDHNTIQINRLLSIKTGSCPENCAYCPQSAHYKTGLEKESLVDLQQVIKAAQAAKASGSTRFCMGAAWRGPRDQDLEIVCEMITEIKKMGLETCASLGLLTEAQAMRLKEARLDFYNHNIDTSPEFYETIISTRTFEDRIKTLDFVRKSGIKVCCGGILGMGETNDDRIKMLIVLASLDEQPESVPINRLMKIPGTPLENQEDIDPFDFVRTVALARIMLPKTYIRLAAGREQMSDELQALCFMSGANSIFYGDKLLTANNPIPERDDILLQKLGLAKLQ